MEMEPNRDEKEIERMVEQQARAKKVEDEQKDKAEQQRDAELDLRVSKGAGIIWGD
jgi:hypothetical protein